MEVNCEFKEPDVFGLGKVYCCDVRNASIDERGQEIAKFTGNHLSGKADKDVQLIVFNQNKNLQFVPRGLAKTFKNICGLSFKSCSIRSITKRDLSGLPNLRMLWLLDNKLTSLPGNLFEDSTKLEFISFESNNISSIGGNLLEPLKALQSIDFENNATINMFYNATGEYQGSVTLDQMKKKIVQTAPSSNNIQFADNIKAVLSSGMFKDCTINIEGEKFRAHRFILAAGSPVLMKIFEEYHEINEVKFENISPDIFQIILDVLYGESMPAYVEDAHILNELLSAAHKLKMKKLKSFVTTKLLSKVDCESVTDLMIASEIKRILDSRLSKIE